MKHAMRCLIAIFLTVIIFICIAGCFGCRGKTTPPPTKPSEPSAPELSKDLASRFSGDTKFSITLAGERKWVMEVKSGEVSSDKGRQVLTLSGLNCHLYKQGREVFRVSADKGKAIRIGDTLTTEFYGHVQAVENKLNQQLNADSYRWVSSDDVVKVKNFTLIGEKGTLSADEGTISLDMTEANFHGHVRMNITGR